VHTDADRGSSHFIHLVLHAVEVGSHCLIQSVSRNELLKHAAHLKPAIELGHLLRILSLGHPYTLLHLLRLDLYVLSQRDKLVHRGFKAGDEWFGIKG
jgi:hypothetical protein